jgi:hypothetical protein
MWRVLADQKKSDDILPVAWQEIKEVRHWQRQLMLFGRKVGKQNEFCLVSIAATAAAIAQ